VILHQCLESFLAFDRRHPASRACCPSPCLFAPHGKNHDTGRQAFFAKTLARGDYVTVVRRRNGIAAPSDLGTRIRCQMLLAMQPLGRAAPIGDVSRVRVAGAVLPGVSMTPGSTEVGGDPAILVFRVRRSGLGRDQGGPFDAL